MKQYILIGIYTIIGFFIGIGISEHTLNNDPMVHHLLHDILLQQFQSMYDCKAKASIESLNLLKGSIVLKDIYVCSTHTPANWSWQSNRCSIIISPLAWLFTNNIPVQLTFDHFDLNTIYKNGTCTILPHFQKMIAVPETPTPFFIHQLQLPQVNAHVCDITNAPRATIAATYEMVWQHNSIKNLIILKDAHVALHPSFPFTTKGAIAITVFDPLHKCMLNVTTTQQLAIALAGSSYTFDIQGRATNTQATVTIKKDNHTIATLTWRSDGTVHIKSSLDLSDLGAFPAHAQIDIQGNTNTPYTAAAHTHLVDDKHSITYAGTWQISPTNLLYSLGTLRKGNNQCDIVACIDPLHQYAFAYLHNNNELSFGSFSGAPGTIKALARIDHNRYSVRASYDTYTMRADGTLLPSLSLPHGSIQYKNKQLLSFAPDPHQASSLKTALDCAFFDHPQLHTQGSCIGTVQWHYPTLMLNCSCTTPWHIPALGTHITETHLEATGNVAAQTVHINKATCILDKGTIETRDGIITKEQIAIPIKLSHCFVRPDPDIYALISGDLVLQQMQQPTLQGMVTINQCFYKKNILAASPQLALPSVPDLLAKTWLDVKVETEQPISVKTAFLTGDVHSHLHVGNTIGHPLLQGTLDLVNVSLHFPYKQLHITQGSLTFFPYQPLDPLINVTAKNRIKKYQVTLRVHGNIHNPIVHLESSPSLSSEKILALLLTGSEEQSLAIAVPTLIMQQLQQLMFGPAMTNSALLTYFKKFTKPFKKVRFIPHLTDQSARGGIRAGLEINYNDKLRAYIQQNLTLTEDTLFEVEYQCTDHVGIKGIKDEHGDLGAEVEMRWKF